MPSSFMEKEQVTGISAHYEKNVKQGKCEEDHETHPITRPPQSSAANSEHCLPGAVSCGISNAFVDTNLIYKNVVQADVFQNTSLSVN